MSKTTSVMRVVGLVLLVVVAGCAGRGGSEMPDSTQADGTSADASTVGAGPCDWVAAGPLSVVPDLGERARAYVPTELSPDLDHLDATQRAVLGKLVDAAKIMNAMFQQQATPCFDELRAHVLALPRQQRTDLLRYFDINFGPWDRRQHHEPFLGDRAHPEGANYYPQDLTAAEREQIEVGQDGLDGLFTMVRRDQTGALAAIPYSEFFADRLQQAAQLLREAADLTENATLRAFLRARAAAFLSDDYYESDMLWMDLDSMVEVTIGPYETYEDGLFGYKAAFEAFVTVTDPVESARLADFKDELPWLEAHLPIPDQYKNFDRGSESPIRVVDEVYSAGDTRAGIQTIAFNLPNDERVREAKGSKKVLLRNVMKAKFDQILMPIARTLVAEDQLGDLTAESFFLHTLWHEMSHGLGPGRIVKGGRDTEVRLELKEHYSTLEEAKADAMGEWDIFVLARAGRDYFGPEIYREQAATYLAGLFRSVRFGIAEAHGQANAIQFNYLTQQGAVRYDESTGRFGIDVETFEKAIEDLVAEICLIQAEGDYEAAGAFIQRYGGMAPSLAAGLAKLDGIPVDIEPLFPRFD